MKDSKFIKLYEWVLEVENISPNEKILYCLIKGYEENGKGCFISNNALADKLKVGEQQIWKSVKKLKNCGLLEEFKESRKRYLKTILPKDIKEEPQTEIEEEESVTPIVKRGKPQSIDYDPTEDVRPVDPEEFEVSDESFDFDPTEEGEPINQEKFSYKNR